jgi:5'-methylthioadenosine phosphorylase
VKLIVAFSAVGSLREEIKPRDFVIPSQIIDRTKGIRESTFFDSGVVGHIGQITFNIRLADPFTKELCDMVQDCFKQSHVDLHVDKTLICMEGPAFSTRAESNLYRSWGADLINMSVMPEAKLAAEAEICYSMVIY